MSIYSRESSPSPPLEERVGERRLFFAYKGLKGGHRYAMTLQGGGDETSQLPRFPSRGGQGEEADISTYFGHTTPVVARHYAAAEDSTSTR